MPITVSWDNEQKTAFIWTFQGKWTWLEYVEALKKADLLALEVNHPIDVIVDFRASSVIPSNVLSNLRTNLGKQPEKLGLIVVVGTGAFVTAIITMLARIIKRFDGRLFTTDTLDKARRLLAERRQEALPTQRGTGPLRE